jgi:hypothetical protein
MKKPEHIIDSTIDLDKKRNKQKGGTSFNNLKHRKWRKLKKKEESYIEGRGIPSDLQNTCEESKKGSLQRHLNLQPIENKRKDSDSPPPSMANSEHHNNSNQSGSHEETTHNSILLKICCRGYMNNGYLKI